MVETVEVQRQLGYGKNTIRSEHDFYITPDFATMELLKRENFKGLGWEPACGNGAISKFFPEMEKSDLRTDSSIVGEKGIDFLKTTRQVDYIVTNPPFSLMLEFAKHSLECAKKIALFGKIQFLEGIERYNFFQKHPPIKIYVFSNRLNCSPTDSSKSGMMCFIWAVWERGYIGKPTLDWIARQNNILSRDNNK